jgi:hypothetical protein
MDCRLIDIMFSVISVWAVRLRPGLKYFKLNRQGKHSQTLSDSSITKVNCVKCFCYGHLSDAFFT